MKIMNLDIEPSENIKIDGLSEQELKKRTKEIDIK